MSTSLSVVTSSTAPQDASGSTLATNTATTLDDDGPRFVKLSEHVYIEPDEDDEMATSTTLSAAARPTQHEMLLPVSRGSRQDHAYTSAAEYDLPALQSHNHLATDDQFEPNLDDDPASYDLVLPPTSDGPHEEYSLEKRSQSLFSKAHLQVIFSDPTSLLRFTSFLSLRRPQSVPILVHYLDALKSLRALHYANAIVDGLDAVDGLDFTKSKVPHTRNEALEARANAAFDHMVNEELPAFIAHQYIKVVSSTISLRISGSLAPQLREASEGLAEVFCLTDPSRPDNPIVFASEEFNRTTQYGMSYVLGRNCRFLQGPWTNPAAVARIRTAVQAGKQCQEVFLNYRRDGSPFMNLLLCAPLCDSQGRVRYFIGAQVDVSGLVKECAELESYETLIDLESRGQPVPDPQVPSDDKNDELQELSEMLNHGELSTIRRHGGRMHRDAVDDDDADSLSSRPRLTLKDPLTITPPIRDVSGKLSGVYQHYLLVRPYPSLRVLFASPSQRVPGILQSPLMDKIGGSLRVKDELVAALAEGRSVTAKVRWVAKHERSDEPHTLGRNKWIHCTPLIGSNGKVGVWMVVIVDDTKPSQSYSGTARRAPPLVAPATTNGHYTPSSGHRSHPGHRPGDDGTSLNGSFESFRLG